VLFVHRSSFYAFELLLKVFKLFVAEVDFRKKLTSPRKGRGLLVQELSTPRHGTVKLMKTHLSQSGGQDPDSVNIYQPRTIQLWSRKFGCTKEQLQQAVQRVGTSPGAVRAELGRKVPLRSK
jgi:hypothetical protein